MHVLALNPGSATLKYRLFDLPDDGGGRELAKGTIDHVAGDTTARAAEEAATRCLPFRLDALGCRVVHGGARFPGPAIVTEEVLAAIEALGRLAPLHNPVAVSVLRAAHKLLPSVP